MQESMQQTQGTQPPKCNDESGAHSCIALDGNKA